MGVCAEIKNGGRGFPREPFEAAGLYCAVHGKAITASPIRPIPDGILHPRALPEPDWRARITIRVSEAFVTGNTVWCGWRPIYGAHAIPWPRSPVRLQAGLASKDGAVHAKGCEER